MTTAIIACNSSNGSEKDLSVEDGDGSMLSQYPNPAVIIQLLIALGSKADVQFEH